jgi:hypothetical protein
MGLTAYLEMAAILCCCCSSASLTTSFSRASQQGGLCTQVKVVRQANLD